jgi:hypothetical protein
VSISSSYDLSALLRTLNRQGLSKAVIAAVERHYNLLGVESLPASLHLCPSEASQGVADVFVESIDLDNSDLMNGLSAHHWLMENKIGISLLLY